MLGKGVRAPGRGVKGGLTRHVRERLEVGLFLAGLLALAFGYGVAVGKGLLFPHVLINNAVDAARDWRENWRQYLGLRSEFVLPSGRTAGGVTRYDRAAAWPGDTFLTMFHDGRFGALLVDMEGRALHRWDVAVSRVWPGQAVFDGVRLADDDVDIHGTALLPNGDAILNLNEAGTVRVDRCSRVLWKVPGETHHSVDPLPDGDTLVPARYRRTGVSAARPRLAPGPNGFYWEDTVRRVRPDGSVAEEVPVLDMLYASGWQALLFAGPGPGATIRAEDPTHLNDAEVLREAMAPAFPMFRAGDVLLSLRNLDTLVVADPRTWRVKWAMTGPFLGQHDPDFLPDGHLLVFDNRGTGDRPAFGGSRVLEIDPATREVVWSYDGGGEPFYTKERGSQQALPNGDVLVTAALEGRVFEVTRENPGRVVWEYVNLVRPGLVGLVTGAERVDPAGLTFLGQGCG
jgi:Arylsulfotransferase (ASST)